MNILIGIYQSSPHQRALYLRPNERKAELVDYMIPGSTIHKLPESNDTTLLLQMAELQREIGECQRV